ncbi:TPA: hypothetical protein ACH3X1_009878 [Trebouxia sp. C0004]
MPDVLPCPVRAEVGQLRAVLLVSEHTQIIVWRDRSKKTVAATTGSRRSSRVVCLLALCLQCGLVTAPTEPCFQIDEARVNRGSHNAAHSISPVAKRDAVASRSLLSSGNTTMFSDGWAQGWGWVASGARNISNVPGTGVNQNTGLCTTLAGTGGYILLSCGDCSQDQSMPYALNNASGIGYAISHFTNVDMIGSSPQTSIANSTIPMGLQWVIQDSTGFPCHTPLGPAYSINNKLVQSMTPFQAFPNNQDCQSALQGATAIGLQALWANISFCIDDVQLLSSTVVSQVLLHYEPTPGLLNRTHIYSGGLQMGWSVNSSTEITFQQITGAGVGGEHAICADLPAFQDDLRFTCPDCPANGFQPFLANVTAGFEMWISRATMNSSGSPGPNASFPLLQTQVLDVSGVSLCSLPLLPTGLQRNNLWQATALYQNGQDCIAVLGTAASLSFVSDAASGQSLCVDQIQMLPSSMSQPGVPSNALPIPDFPNCVPGGPTYPQWYVQPQPTNENGNFTVTGHNPALAHNVTGKSLAEDYILFQNLALPNALPFLPSNGTCSNVKSANITLAFQCAGSNNISGTGSCCYDTNAAHYQDGDNGTALPAVLAEICNNLWLLPRVCQGFVYDELTGIASFLGQDKDQLIELSKQPQTCSRPGSSLWLLNAAIPQAGALLADPRQPPTPASSKGSNTAADVGTVLGILLGVAGPAAGVAAWLTITYSYRRSKRRLVLQVGKQLQLKHISYDKDIHSNNATQHSSPNMVQMTTLTNPLITSQSSGLQRDSSMTPLTDELIPAEVPSTGMKEAAMQIAQQLLRRWDAALGIRPGTDAGGAKAGIWRRKFDGVRCASLLLAFQKFNKILQMQSGKPDTLMQAWMQSTSARQRREVVSAVAQTLQTISQAEAQALPDKDPDVSAIL